MQPLRINKKLTRRLEGLIIISHRRNNLWRFFDPILIKSLEMFDKENSPSYCEIWEKNNLETSPPSTGSNSDIFEMENL